MRRNRIAVAVLAALAVAAFLVLRERPAADGAAVAKAISPVPAASVDRIEIFRRDPAQDQAAGEQLAIERRGADWRLVAPVDYPLNPSAVKSMTDALAGLSPIDVISDNKEKHAALGVDDAQGIRVKAFGGGKVLADLVIGVSRGDMTMVRRAGEDAVYRVQESFRAVFNKSSRNLRDHVIAKLDRGSVARAVFTYQGETLEIEKTAGGDAVYAPVGAEIQNFDSHKAEATLNGLTALVTHDFVDKPISDEEAGFGEGGARVDFEATKDGAKGKFTVWIGKDVEKDRETYLKTSLSNQVYLVAAQAAARLRVRAQGFARTDAQVAAQEKARQAAEERAKTRGAGALSPTDLAAGAQNLPPEIMQQLQEKLRAQQAGSGATR
jgi:hypothetical protein